MRYRCNLRGWWASSWIEAGKEVAWREAGLGSWARPRGPQGDPLARRARLRLRPALHPHFPRRRGRKLRPAGLRPARADRWGTGLSHDRRVLRLEWPELRGARSSRRRARQCRDVDGRRRDLVTANRGRRSWKSHPRTGGLVCERWCVRRGGRRRRLHAAGPGGGRRDMGERDDRPSIHFHRSHPCAGDAAPDGGLVRRRRPMRGRRHPGQHGNDERFRRKYPGELGGVPAGLGRRREPASS